MRVMASEMKAAAADFNLTGNEMDYLTRKSSSLNDQIKQQETIIKALEDAVESGAKAWGETSEKVDEYRIKLSNAQASMSKLRKELQDTDAELAELGRDSARVGRQLEEGIGEAAEDVADKFDRMVNKLDADVGSVGKTLDIAAGFTIGGQIVDGAIDAAEAVAGLVDSSMEYNRAMSFLEVNAALAGYRFEEIEKYAISVAGITGDMDAAVEGMSNLLKAGFEGDEMAKAVKLISGAIIEMPDTLKFEEMANSLMESVKTGSAVGQYAEYLQAVGMDLEVVNEALEAAKKNGQEAAESAALAMLSGHGAEETLAKWKEDNADMVAYYTAQAELTKAQAELATVLTPAATAVIELASGVVEDATALVESGIELYKAWETKRDAKWAEEDKEREVVEEQTGYYSDLERLNAEIRKADVAGDMVLANKLLEERSRLIKEIAEATKELDTAEAGTEKVEELIDADELKETGKTGGEAIVSGIDEGATEAAIKAEASFETTGENLVTEMTNGAVEQSGGFLSAMQDMWDAAKHIFDRPIQPSIAGGGWDNGYDTGGGNGVGTSGRAVINLDGRKVGDGMVDYNNASLGASVDRATMYVF
ncbi:MAG: hypothetical protein IKK34_01780 [Clostridia bacterium]|nr:hypothetical protein [Clostridia bacterium]